MNIRKLYLKNFKSSFKNYRYFILSGIIGLSVFIILSFILDIVNAIRLSQNLINLDEYYSFIKIIKNFYLILALGLLLYNFKNYSYKRFEDYSILTILGAEQSIIERLISLEIITIYFISIIIGTALSAILLFVMLYFTKIDIGLIIIELNFINILGIYVYYFIIFIFCILYSVWQLDKKSSFEIINKSNSSRKKKNISLVGGTFGLIMSIGSLLFLLYFYNREGFVQYNIFIIFISFFLTGVGAYLTIINFKALNDTFIPFCEAERYKRFLKHNGFFYRINKNSLTIFIYFIITIIIFLIGSIEVDNYTQTRSGEYYKNQYPFNIILVSSNEENIRNIDLDPKLDVKTIKAKMIEWRRPDDYSSTNFELNGILTTTKELSKLTDREYRIKNGNINFSEQIFEDIRYPALYGYKEIIIADKDGQGKTYRIFDSERKYILGNFDNYLGDAFISTDEKTFLEIPGKRFFISGIKLPEELKSNGKEDFIKQLKEKLMKSDVKYYETYELIEKQKSLNFFKVLSTSFILMLLSVIKYLLTYINTTVDLDYFKNKYFILRVCGLDEKSYKSMFRSEFSLCFIIPILLSILFVEILFLLVAEDHKNINILLNINYIIWFFVLLDYIYYKILTNTMLKMLDKGEKSG